MLNIRATFAPAPGAVIEVGAGGERLAANIRVVFFLVIWLVPLSGVFVFGDRRPESLVGLVAATIALAVAALFVWMARRDLHVPGIAFITTGFDISIVSAVLAAFALSGKPLVATNSMLVWECYLIFIIASSIRFDMRVCLAAGLLSVIEYVSILYLVIHNWDLSASEFRNSIYGQFSWTVQVGRILLMLTATVLACGIVLRSRKLLHVSGIDQLTGLGNRLYFDARFAGELSRAARRKETVVLAFLDVDHFKRFNDKWGHKAGDVALTVVANALTAAMRGEEFVVVLPDTDVKGAMVTIGRIQKKLAMTPVIKDNSESLLTLSGGIAEFPADGNTASDLTAVADARLYRAKQAGRDRVLDMTE